MNSALPSNLINPAFAELEQAAAADDTNFAQETIFLFKCWQSYDVQTQFAADATVPRCRNLFWRVWSNPNLRPISNSEFNGLWQRCGRTTALSPYRPDPALWPSCQEPKEPPPIQAVATHAHQSPRSPVSPRAATITFDQGIFEAHPRSTRERGSGGAPVNPSRPAFRRSTSNRTANSSGPARGGRNRPGLPRRKSSQSRPSARTSDTAVAQVASQGDAWASSPSKLQGTAAVSPEGLLLNAEPAANRGGFELASSWQSDDDSSEEKASQPGETGSLVQPDFRTKFAEQRLSSGTSLPTTETVRKVRSSVRFVDDDNSTEKGKAGERPGLEVDDIGESLERSNSQALADSDDSDDKGGLPRVQSQLSVLIKDKRKQSGSQDLGPSSQPESERITEARRKREELLRMGREAAAPIIPTSRSRRPSREEEDGRYRSPSPNATF